MKKLNVVVIGAGSMGRNHARVYADMDEVELVAVCDANAADAEHIAERYHCKAFSDYKKMLAEMKPDMASIAVPTNLHYAIGKDCIRAGVHVLIEKPIASTVEQAEELIRIAREKKVVLTVGHTERFNPAVTALRERIGDIGKVFKISASRLSPFPSRIVDMGVVVDLAVHDIDVFYYILGEDVIDVSAMVDRRLHKQHEDMLIAAMRFKGGALGVLNVDRLTPVPVRELRVTGSKGMFEVNYLLQDLYLYKNNSAEEESSEYTQHIMGVTPGDVVKVRINKREPLRLELESFAQTVRSGGKPKVTGEEALRALALAQRLLKASQKGGGA